MGILKTINATGTFWNIEIFDTNYDIEKIQMETEEFIEQFEQKYSRFRSDSWLEILNTSGNFHKPTKEFRVLLSKAVSMYTQTNGVFNIAVGQNMNESGYDAQYSFCASKLTQTPILTEILHITDTQITLDEGRLDLGGIGKGFLIDLLTKMYTEKLGLQYFIINGGGDIYTTSNFGKPVAITLVHPYKNNISIGTVSLFHQGFAASSPYVRTWTDKNSHAQYNHLQTSNQVSSYAVADNACNADIWATTIAIDPGQKSDTIKSCVLCEQRIIRCDAIFKLNE